jgi:hypothetical protein
VLPRLAAPIAALLLVTLAACTQAPSKADVEAGPSPEVAEVAEPPELGACRVLTPEDITQVSNDSEVVECSEPHTAETFAVGTFPKSLTADGAYDNPDLGAFMFDTCSTRFQKFLGGDESTVMRSTLSWAWFRPSEEAWQDGARWYRCDVVGGGEQSKAFVNLPTTAKGLLLGKPDDRWMVCVNGPTVSGSVKIPCSEPHTWRAVTTIKLGQPEDPYPGDRVAEVRTRDYCSDSVGAWLNYPVDYDFGYTWFHEQEWKAGNRRSICWAKTDQ